MKALSIRQPWAWLIANGHKDIENRTWQEMRDVVHAKAESPWQPMDTAPKDRPILGRADGVCAVVEWYAHIGGTYHRNGILVDGWWQLCVVGTHADDGEWTPLEWMEIPE